MASSSEASLSLMDDDRPQKALSPITLASRHDHSLVVQAIEHRLDDLGKLSKKAADEGYASIARTVDADASALREQVLPHFREQRELPLDTFDNVLAALEAYLGSTSREVLTVEGEDRDQAIIHACAQRVARAVIEAAERGLWAGMAARGNSPQSIAIRSIEAARGIRPLINE